MEYDIDVEENFGKTGRTARRQREVQKKEKKHFSGNQARELYLECLQLTLRKQVAWLVREHELPLELETIVRDLWDLRVRYFKGLAVARRGREGRRTKTETQSASDSEPMLYSSQRESEVPTGGTSGTSRRRSHKSVRKNWTSEDGEHWEMPNLLDTLALIYLGCLTIRQPMRITDLYRWAERNELPYRRAVSCSIGVKHAPAEVLANVPFADKRNSQGDER